MQVEQIIQKFIKYPKALTNGAGNLSKRWGCSREDIYKARSIVRNRMRYGTDYMPKDVAFNKVKLPKILIFDIETSPSISFTWKRFKENISLDQVIQDPIMLTWSAKWLYSNEIISDAITPQEVINFDDKRITTSLWKMLNEADMVVAHYGDNFDIPFLNSRSVINVLPPYLPVTSIDTKAVAKALISTKYIGFFEGIQKSSTELYAKQIPQHLVNTGSYTKEDVVFVSVIGNRGNVDTRRINYNIFIRSSC